ncbi:MAG: sigma-70 family RNA polymerase sigma factor [Lentisphaeria bacterium]|nr:sigma-70 family RNA polymerase sigma factor [Lentisphaeria bacterium]
MDHDATTDNEWIEGWLRGDQEAFEALYNRYRLPLYSYLNRMVPGQSQLADDLFQQVWIRVLENLERYRDKQRFVSWLFRIAHNLVVDHIRRETRNPMEEVNERTAVDESAPWEELDREVLIQAVERASADLPEAQREVLLLRQQGVSFREIAAIQSTGINTVLGRMHYAVKGLRRSLGAYVT